MPQSKKVPFWRSLQTKFAMTYILIVAAVLILLNTYPVMVSQDLAYRSKETSMQNQAAVLASALATGPEALTAEGAARTVELLLGSLGVTRIVVTDPNGLVLCDFQEGTARTDTVGQYALFWELVTALQGNDVFRSDYADGVFHSRAAVPVTYRSMTQGAVYLYEYDAEQGAMLQGIQTNLRFISLVICLVTLVMGVVFAKALTRRIALLLGAIRTVREGEYSHRVSMGGGDELSRLADEFNELTGRLKTTEEARTALREVLCEMVSVGDTTLNLSTKPSVVLVIGVNGVGKTTTIGKIAHQLKGQGKKVLLCAADTFRAAAADQLEIWAGRAGVDIIRQDEGADPASVVYDAIAAAKARGTDVILCDTAGRLHNKQNLMNELGKISRILDRELPDAAKEVLLVLDGTTGQNGLLQNQLRHLGMLLQVNHKLIRHHSVHGPSGLAVSQLLLRLSF